jgi:hypothetical protein
LFLTARGLSPARVVFIFVSHALYRHGAAFFAHFLDFSRALLLKSGVICPLHAAKIAGCRKILPGRRTNGKIPPGRFFLARAKLMFNRKLLPGGTSLAKDSPGKTPKEHLLLTRTESQKCPLA